MEQSNYKLPLLVEQKDGSFQIAATGGSVAAYLNLIGVITRSHCKVGRRTETPSHRQHPITYLIQMDWTFQNTPVVSTTGLTL